MARICAPLVARSSTRHPFRGSSASHGVRANCISPGTVSTPSTARILADEELLNTVLEPLLIKRLGEPVDIGAPVTPVERAELGVVATFARRAVAAPWGA